MTPPGPFSVWLGPVDEGGVSTLTELAVRVVGCAEPEVPPPKGGPVVVEAMEEVVAAVAEEGEVVAWRISWGGRLGAVCSRMGGERRGGGLSVVGGWWEWLTIIGSASARALSALRMVRVEICIVVV